VGNFIVTLLQVYSIRETMNRYFHCLFSLQEDAGMENGEYHEIQHGQ